MATDDKSDGPKGISPRRRRGRPPLSQSSDSSTAPRELASSPGFVPTVAENRSSGLRSGSQTPRERRERNQLLAATTRTQRARSAPTGGGSKSRRENNSAKRGRRSGV